jgi:DNA-binding PadR family transcriptional regulator
MTKEQLTPLMKVILEAINRAAKPVSRREIAHDIGRGTTLNAYDVQTLKRLIDAGFITEQTVIVGVAREEYRYIATAAGNRALGEV